MLWKKLKEDDFDTDIIEVLQYCETLKKASAEKKSSVLFRQMRLEMKYTGKLIKEECKKT